MNKFSKKEPINFCKCYVVREPFSSTKVFSNYIVEIKLMSHCKDDQLKKVTTLDITPVSYLIYQNYIKGDCINKSMNILNHIYQSFNAVSEKDSVHNTAV